MRAMTYFLVSESKYGTPNNKKSFGTRKYVIALIRYTQSQKIWTPNNELFGVQSF
jgi:hypothetical protein